MYKFRCLILLVLVLLPLLVCSCKSNGQEKIEYNSYIVDMANDGILSDIEREWWAKPSEHKNVESTVMSTEFFGSTYTVEYQHSKYPKFSKNQVDYYYGNGVELSVSSDDQSFRGIHFSLINNDYKLKADKDDPYIYALHMANDIAKDYIDLSRYTLLEDRRSIDSSLTIYTFEFVNYIDQYETTDRLYVSITSKGDLQTLSIGDIGQYRGMEQYDCNEDSIYNSIIGRLDEFYLDKGQYTFNIVSQTLTITPENELAIVSQIEVAITSYEGTTYHTGVVLATIIESSIDL